MCFSFPSLRFSLSGGRFLALTPLFEPKPEILRFETEDRTDVHKGKRPTRISSSEPFFGFSGQSQNMPPFPDKLFLKAVDSIFKHRPHQSCFSALSLTAGWSSIKLFG